MSLPGRTTSWVWHEGPWNASNFDGYLGHGSASVSEDPAKPSTDFQKDKETGLFLPDGAKKKIEFGFRA